MPRKNPNPGTRKYHQPRATDKVTPAMQEQIAKLSLRGMGPKAIAEALGGVVARRTVNAWIAKFDQEHLVRAQEATDLRIARHNAQVEQFILEAWVSFERSRKAEPLKVIKEDGTVTWEDGPGDPRWLAVGLQAMDRRAKLLGTDKAPEPVSLFIGNPLASGQDMTLEQAAEVLALSGAQLTELAQRTQAELAAARATNLEEARGESGDEPGPM